MAPLSATPLPVAMEPLSDPLTVPDTPIALAPLAVLASRPLVVPEFPPLLATLLARPPHAATARSVNAMTDSQGGLRDAGWDTCGLSHRSERAARSYRNIVGGMRRS